MEFGEVVRRRRMTRRYSDEPVDPEVVVRALEHATRAPSAGHTQGWAFVVLDTPADVRRYWEATTTAGALAEPGPWLAGMMTAPVVIVPCSSERAYLERYAQPDKQGPDKQGPDKQEPDKQGPDKGWDRSQKRWAMPYWHLDTAMASLLVLLTAADEGLGSCFFGVPPDCYQPLRVELGIPEDHTPIGAITLGHRARDAGTRGSAATRPRRDLASVVHRGGWNPGQGGER